MSFSHISFLSGTLGFHTNVYVTLPKESGEGAPYRTLYLLHGGAGNALDWIRFTSIERWAGEHGVAVVMPEVGGDSFYADMVHGYKYFTYISEELPKVMEFMFPLSSRREDRLVAGLSMGGYGAFKWALNCPEFFCAAANLSGASNVVDFFGKKGPFQENKNDDMIERDWGSIEELRGSMSDSEHLLELASKDPEKYPRLFVGIGTEDFSYKYAVDYMETARSLGVPIHYEEMPGTHEWAVWDEMIKRFLDWEKEGEKAK